MSLGRFWKPGSPTQHSWCKHRPPWKPEGWAQSGCNSGAPGRTQTSQQLPETVETALSPCHLTNIQLIIFALLSFNDCCQHFDPSIQKKLLFDYFLLAHLTASLRHDRLRHTYFSWLCFIPAIPCKVFVPWGFYWIIMVTDPLQPRVGGTVDVEDDGRQGQSKSYNVQSHIDDGLKDRFRNKDVKATQGINGPSLMK